MGRFLSPDSGLARGLSYVGDMMLLNFLFLLCSLPLVTIGASAAALYTVTLRMVREEHAGIVRPFLRAFRENFGKATVLWLLILAGAALVWLGTGVVKENPGVFPYVVNVVYLIAAVLLWLLASLVFALTARFENTIWNTMKNALILGVVHPLQSAVIMVLTALVPALALFATYLFLATSLIWFLFGFSGTAVFNSILFRKIFDQLTP